MEELIHVRRPADSEHTRIVTKISPRSVSETVSRLTELLSARGITLFAVIDQRAEAQKAGLDLRETTLVTFGNPAWGTPVMSATPLAALDLPLKVVVWADRDTQPTTTRCQVTPPSRVQKIAHRPSTVCPAIQP